MKVREIMSGRVHVVDANASLRDAAQIMQREDIGSVPVSENAKLIGMVTDRDIVVRAVAQGKQDKTTVREIMSSGVKYCFDDDTVDDVARNMSELGIRRLPVVNRDKQLVGFVSLANISSAGDSSATEDLLEGTAQPH